jgi:Holliday junction resolvasome RuvABC endonuclease subunit
MHGKTAKQVFDYVIGIDASLTSAGVYCLACREGRQDINFTVKSTTDDGTDARRVRMVANTILEALSDLNADIGIVCIEDYGPISKFAGKLMQRAEICGILKYALHETWGVPFVTVPPVSLKSYATGIGKAHKDDMIRHAKKFGFFTEVHDEADAFHLARLGKSLMNGARIGVAYQLFKP